MSQVQAGVLFLKLVVLHLPLISCPCFSVNFPQSNFHFIFVFILAPFLCFLSASAVWTAWKDGFCLGWRIPSIFVLEEENPWACCLWIGPCNHLTGTCALYPCSSLCKLLQKGSHLFPSLTSLCSVPGANAEGWSISTARPCKDFLGFHMALNANKRFVVSFESCK